MSRIQGCVTCGAQTDLPAHIHVLFVNLRYPGVRVVTTPYDQRWRTVKEFAEENHLAAATNGGFWGKMMRAWGVSAGFGKRWPVGEDDDEIGFFAISPDGKAFTSRPSEVFSKEEEPAVSEAVSGWPQLVRHGKIDEEALKACDYSRYRHPRTAVGVAKGGDEVILIVVSGRQSHSRGINLYELARLFIGFGADSAINLDGGGSSTMYVAEQGGVVNSPSGGRWIARLGFGAESKTRKVYKVRTDEAGKEEAFVRGVEREVMNHIGVIAPSSQSANEPLSSLDGGINDNPYHSQIKEKGPELHIETPREPPLSFGKFREYLFPILYVCIACVPFVLLGAFVWLRRRRKRKSKDNH
ncbi:MAG: phosphodiester glycosidase family protein [Myxococcales bacterium]|nr:MAG: phosphodiester glycosidase family protein [Myxococcales bacterium]